MSTVRDDTEETDVDFAVQATSGIDFDLEEDRDLTHNLVGCTIKIFYDDQGEWFEGKITWFNNKMNKLRLYFPDDSEDYISEEDINGMDILLLV